MTTQQKIEKINNSNMPFKLRLNAIVTSDNRQGQKWGVK